MAQFDSNDVRKSAYEYVISYHGILINKFINERTGSWI